MPTDAGPKKSAGKKNKGLQEALLDDALGPQVTKTQKAAMLIHLALAGKFFDNVPSHKTVWDTYVSYFKWDGRGTTAVYLLLTLSLFETPLWCNESGFWTWESSLDRCSVEGKATRDYESGAGFLIMSNVPLIPIGIGMIIEALLYAVVFKRLQLMNLLNKKFRDENLGKIFSDNFGHQLFFVVLATLDLVMYVSMGGSSDYRIAPFARFGLATFTIPSVRKASKIFVHILNDLTEIGAFLIGTIVIFAWATTMIFDDLSYNDPYGDPVNTGLNTLGESLYTAFVVVTTANLPDCLVFSYASQRVFIWLWMPFICLSAVVFVQVVLAVVYNCYSDKLEEALKAVAEGRTKAIKLAFAHMQGPPTQEGVDGPVSQRDFNTLIDDLEDFMPINKNLISIIFEAIDSDNNGQLSAEEFNSVCDVVQYNYQVVKRDSVVRGACPQAFVDIMHNDSDSKDFGYDTRFEGCTFGAIMNFVLWANVAFMVIESYYDFTPNWHEPEYFIHIDLFFSFVYVIEVVAKLMIWSWGEYWTSFDNRFDFLSTIVLASGGFASLFLGLSHDMLRYINILRVLRLVKALSNVGRFRKTMDTIVKMMQTCEDVLVMNVLVIYLFSAAGVALFGGELYKHNPAYNGTGGDLDYFDSNFQVFSFNDMFLGSVTLFFVMLTGWLDQVSAATIALHPTYSPMWFVTFFFHLSFYIASVLLAFNVFAAFSIDVYCKLKDLEKAGPDDSQSTLEKNLSDIQERLWGEGKQLHVFAAGDVEKMRVYRGMFDDDDDDDDDNDGGDGGDGGDDGDKGDGKGDDGKGDDGKADS